MAGSSTSARTGCACPTARRPCASTWTNPAVAAGPREGVLVRQYRFPVRRTTLEIPAGKFDGRENPLACIRRELREETGYSARKIKKLLDFWPTPAFANERLTIYLAEGLIPGALDPDPDEFLEVVVLPFREALRMVRCGRIRDSKTVIDLLACAGRRLP